MVQQGIIRSPEEIKDFLARHKSELEVPHVYLGQEPNSLHRDWSKAKVKILFASSWDYASFRGNQTLPLLYQMLSEWRTDIIIERSHVPQSEKDYKLFKKYGIPIFSVESKRSMGEFDIVMTSIAYPSPWVNFPLMLNMSGIPPFWKDRENEEYPLIMVGGAACFGNFCFAYPVVDVVYIGEAEEENGIGLIPLLNTYLKEKENGNSKYMALEMAQKMYNNIFVPKLYSPKYGGPVFSGWTANRPGLPSKLSRHICKDMDASIALTKTLPSYTDATMGLGEVEISRGCRGTCAFCGLGWKYRPYRERSRQKAVAALKYNKRNSGASSLCPIAAEFAFYSEKKALIKDLCAESRFVDPLSMRIDAFIEDAQFDSVLSKSGMNQCAWGVEGVSQRLRNRLMKNVTTEDIKKACWTAVEAGGFKRLKFFMINNIGETPEDYEEFYALIKDIMDGFNKAKRKGLSLFVSWTPLIVEPCTPYQWMKPTIETVQPWKEIVARLHALGVKTNRDRPSIKDDWDALYVSQGLHLGDTRFAYAFVKAAIENDRPYYYSFSKGFRNRIAKFFPEEYSWDSIIRPRMLNEQFPWDIVDRGVSKTTLTNLWLKINSGEMDNVVIPLKPKMEECNLEDVKWSNEQEAYHWYVLKYKVDDNFDTVPNAHWKAILHRAAYLTHFPLSVNQQHFFTDRESRNWYGGSEFVGIGTREAVSEEDFKRLNIELIGMQIVGYIELPYGKFSWSKFVSNYEVVVEIPYSKVVERFDEIAKLTEFEVVVPPDKYSASRRGRKIDTKNPNIAFNACIEDAGTATVIYMTLSNVVPIRLFVKALFPKVISRKLYSFSIEKTDMVYKIKNGYEVLNWKPVGQ